MKGKGKMNRFHARQRGILAALAVGMAAVLLCAACSSSSSSNSASGSGSKVVHVFAWGQETAPALGALYPAEPWMASVPAAAVKAINASPRSKVKLTFTFCDSKFTPNGSATCAQQALSPAGCNGSPCTVALDELDLNESIAVEALHTGGMPIVAPTPSSVQVFNTPGVFCLSGTSQAAEPGLGYLLKAAGAHKVGIVGLQQPETAELDQWTQEGLRAQGLTLNGVQNLAGNDPNMQPPITAVMGNGADGLIYGGAFIGPAVGYMRSTYPNAKIAMPSYITDPISLKGIPASATNGISVAAYQQPVTATHVPGVKQYLTETQGAVTSSYKDFDYSLQSWLAVHFIANVAAGISGSVDSASLLQAIKHAENVNMYGIMPPWNASQLGQGGAAACSPYNVWVKESLENNLQVTDEPGVFRSAVTGKVAYVDPGFTAPQG
jgi:ABC-type branched-subunit amino acid transport system substrate-binding protein